MASMKKVIPNMYSIRVFRPSMEWWSKAPFITIFSRIVNFLPKSIAKKVDMVIMPKPPICTKNNITDCPKFEKSAPVSLTIRPVTQVALVAVKNASTSPIEVPSLEL